MCLSAPSVCSKPGGQKPVLSLSLDRIKHMLCGLVPTYFTHSLQGYITGTGVMLYDVPNDFYISLDISDSIFAAQMLYFKMSNVKLMTCNMCKFENS